MNLLDCYVVEILSSPRYEYGKWWVEVIYECYGRESSGAVMCESVEEAMSVRKGHHFLA